MLVSNIKGTVITLTFNSTDWIYFLIEDIPYIASSACTDKGTETLNSQRSSLRLNVANIHRTALASKSLAKKQEVKSDKMNFVAHEANIQLL